MSMRVRLHTSPVGMFLRVAGVFALGGATFLVVEQSDWRAGVGEVGKVAQQVSEPTPSTSPSPTAAPKPSPPPAHVAQSDAALPPGWINIGGITLPPSGYNDR
jgi:hypothetical protein